MRLFHVLKAILLWPISTSAKTVLVGNADTWEIVDRANDDMFVVAAGVGHSITFELDLARRYNAEIILLDPSPTGINTVSKLDISGTRIRFLEKGLAAEDGTHFFDPPQDTREGSYSIAGGQTKDGIQFECTSLNTLMRQYGRRRLDILKMDIEGFEYEVIQNLLKDRLSVDQLCVEIHVRNSSGVTYSIWDAVRLLSRLYFAGYRVIFNRALDFTFVHKTFLMRTAKS